MGLPHGRVGGRGLSADPPAGRPDPPAKILVVEDEPDIAALVAYQLTREGFRVETVDSGTAALGSIGREIPALVVLDRMLPGVSGDQVLEELRKRPETSELRVLMLTAMKEQEDRISGLELGADDYLGKPFSPRELVLRVLALLRRRGTRADEAGGRTLRSGPVSMDLGARRVFVEGDPIELTPTEFRLLEALMERRGRALSRARLLELAWELDAGIAQDIQTRTVDMHVRRLRKKLGPAGEAIETVRGFGYRFHTDPGR